MFSLKGEIVKRKSEYFFAVGLSVRKTKLTEDSELYVRVLHSSRFLGLSVVGEWYANRRQAMIIAMSAKDRAKKSLIFMEI